MAIDSFMLAALTKELDSRLSDGRVDKIYMPSKEKIVISMRAGEGNVRLLLEASNVGKVHITAEREENPESPPMFCMLLRKHLAGGRLISIEQPDFERMMELTFVSSDELGFTNEKYLICEMMGRRNNIILLDKDRRILGCLKRVDTEMSPTRPILPGLIYELPPKQDKISLIDSDSKNFEQAFELGEISARLISDKVASISPFVAREIFTLAQGDREKSIDGILSFQALAKEKNYTPYMLKRDGEQFELSPYLPVQFDGDGLEWDKYSDFSKLLDDFYREKSRSEHKRAESAQLMKFVSNLHERTVRKLANQKNELVQAQNRDELRAKADLIMSNIHLLKKGMKEAELVDYFSEDMPQIKITLDENKSPQQNAQKLYDSFTRMKNAEIMLREQIEKGEHEIMYLDSMVEAVENAMERRDIEAIREELTTYGYIKAKKQPYGKKVKTPKILPRKYITSDGFTVLCGRNNIENDFLTMKQADKQDVWLHARNVPGSHVVIVAKNNSVSESAITEAAGVAAYFSRLSNQPLAAIDYTTVKYVKKIPGAKPGMVTYSNFKTAFVKPELITKEI